MSAEFPGAGGRPVAADLVLPPDRSAAPPVVVLVHGGGWRLGSRGDYAGWAQTLAGAGLASLSIDYTLATPQAASWPAAVEDVAGAFAFVRANAAGLGVDGSRIGVLATSAGAHLSATAVLRADTGVTAAVLVNGVYDLRTQHATSNKAVAALMGTTPEDSPDLFAEASPAALAVVSRRAAGVAWTLVYGERDPVVPPAQSQSFAAVLRAAGAAVRTVPVPAQTHHWNTTTPVDEGTNLVIRDVVLDRLRTLIGSERAIDSDRERTPR